MSGHAFLAVGLSDIHRHDLSAALAAASPGPPIPGKRPPAENWHITLRFLGECTDAEAERVIHEVADVVATVPGRVYAGGLGAFPRASKASVVYASVEDPDGLLSYLAGVCETGAREVGFDPDERRFTPHITLSRLRPVQDVRCVFDAFGAVRVPIDVDGITMFRSIRSREGVRYEPQEVIAL